MVGHFMGSSVTETAQDGKWKQEGETTPYMGETHTLWAGRFKRRGL